MVGGLGVSAGVSGFLLGKVAAGFTSWGGLDGFVGGTVCSFTVGMGSVRSMVFSRWSVLEMKVPGESGVLLSWGFFLWFMLFILHCFTCSKGSAPDLLSLM